MKVTEVACVLGVLTPIDHAALALDIGSGTGLLSLMLAQRSTSVKVDAVELDDEAFIQGEENVKASPFHDRIHCFHGDILSFRPNKKYDLIVCNPPFFEKQLISKNEKRNRAWHSSSFSLEGLWTAMDALLNEKGRVSLLLPSSRMLEVEQLNKHFGFHTEKLISIFHHKDLDTGLRVLILTREELPSLFIPFILREEKHYTSSAMNLFKEFYLKL